MTVTFYRSTDASAPVLTGQAGSLTTLLDAILVNGYGSQAAAGWTIAYTGTNQRDYQQGAGSNGYYLDVNDTAPSTAEEADMVGYETMSALATGTQPFPTSGQSAFGVVCRKSATADATARPWYCVADSTCFYLFIDNGDFTGPSYSTGFMFGDFFSYKVGDTYNTAIIGRSLQNTSNNQYEWFPGLSPTYNPLTLTLAGHYVDRTWTGLGGSIAFGKHSSVLAGYSQSGLIMGSSQSLCNYPNGPDGALELAPVWVGHGGSVRGYLKGLWCPLHNQPLGHANVFNGNGNMAGKSFLALNAQGYVNGTQLGQIIVETSNTWS